jgi:HEPN domain-containing protein
VFHAQQAAEEAMKAFVAWHDTPFRKTHNLEELSGQWVALEAAPLTEYEWKFPISGRA